MNRTFLTITVFFLFPCVLLHALEIRLPSEAALSADEPVRDGTAWRQCGAMPLTYAAARKSFDLALRKQGWHKVRSIEYDRIQWKSLEQWHRGTQQILIQFWREGPSRTGFSWGVIQERQQ